LSVREEIPDPKMGVYLVTAGRRKSPGRERKKTTCGSPKRETEMLELKETERLSILPRKPQKHRGTSLSCSSIVRRRCMAVSQSGGRRIIA
jgi:hypothetical protein